MMPAPYSNDLRERVISAYKDGKARQSEIAERYNISESTLKRYWRRYKSEGHCKAILGNKGRKPLIKEKEAQKVRDLVARYPTATLKELLHHYNRNRKHKIHLITLHRALKRLNIRRKKLSHYAQEQDRSDVQASRNDFKKK